MNLKYLWYAQLMIEMLKIVIICYFLCVFQINARNKKKIHSFYLCIL
jgi:hypothetical protein